MFGNGKEGSIQRFCLSKNYYCQLRTMATNLTILTKNLILCAYFLPRRKPSGARKKEAEMMHCKIKASTLLQESPLILLTAVWARVFIEHLCAGVHSIIMKSFFSVQELQGSCFSCLTLIVQSSFWGGEMLISADFISS